MLCKFIAFSAVGVHNNVYSVCMYVELLIHHLHMKGHLLFQTFENHVPQKYNNNNNNITVFI